MEAPPQGASPRLLHLDDQLLALDKPAGLLVHRSPLAAHEQAAALQWARDASGGLVWPVHRLDRGTSGVLLFARQRDAARALAAAFECGAVRKRYLALVRGWPPERGRIDHPLARDPERPSAGQVLLAASTDYRRLGTVEWPFGADGRHPTSRYALVEVFPQNGRRHQIRRHFKHLGHPLIGDATHGKGVHNRAVAQWLGLQRLWLHAAELSLAHPAHGLPLSLRASAGAEWHALAGRGEWRWDVADPLA